MCTVDVSGCRLAPDWMSTLATRQHEASITARFVASSAHVAACKGLRGAYNGDPFEEDDGIAENEWEEALERGKSDSFCLCLEQLS
jgi:hypothetical protein